MAMRKSSFRACEIALAGLLPAAAVSIAGAQPAETGRTVRTGRIAWEIPDVGGGILASGLMTTAGGLVFHGDSTGGAFVAADAANGKLRWHFNTGQPWKAGPMTCSIGETQYVGVAAGTTIMVFALR